MTGKNINQLFSEEEIRGIRNGIDGVNRAIPARFYHDEAIYQYEVEHLLKKKLVMRGALGPGRETGRLLHDQDVGGVDSRRARRE